MYSARSIPPGQTLDPLAAAVKEPPTTVSLLNEPCSMTMLREPKVSLGMLSKFQWAAVDAAAAQFQVVERR